MQVGLLKLKPPREKKEEKKRKDIIIIFEFLIRCSLKSGVCHLQGRGSILI